MANITITTTDALLPEVWSTLILDTLTDELVMYPNLVDVRYKKFAMSGDRVQVPNVATIAARTLTNMTGTITFDANTETVTTIVLNTLAYTAVKIDEAALSLNPLPLVDLYTTEIGRSVAEKIDTDILAEMDTTSNTRGTDNVAVTETNWQLSMEDLMRLNNKARDGIVVVSAKSYTDMFNIDRFTSSLYAATVGNVDVKMSRGYSGKVLGFPVYVSNNVPAGAAGSKNFMYVKEGIAAIVKEDISVRIREPHDELARGVIAWALYGVKLMRANSIIEVDGR